MYTDKEAENRIITIPNLLSAFRLVLIPVFIWTYCVREEYLVTAGLLLLSGLTAAIGGAYMTMGYASIFSKDMVAGRGWIGIAAQGIAGINYVLLLIVSMIFSVFQAITNVFLLYDLPSELINIIPYVGVLLGVIFY